MFPKLEIHVRSIYMQLINNSVWKKKYTVVIVRCSSADKFQYRAKYSPPVSFISVNLSFDDVKKPQNFLIWNYILT